MDVQFDPDKDLANREKPGLTLAAAALIDFGTATVVADRRYDYGEDRFQLLGRIGGRLHVLIFTMRGDVLRAISLRKANQQEMRRYDQQRR